MNEQVLKCPDCGAALVPPSRFARSTVCAYCKATVLIDPSIVSTARFRDALRDWNAPSSHGYAAWCSIGDHHWALQTLLARGEIADVYRAERARWPSESVVFKVLRDSTNVARFDHEWDVLSRLQGSTAAGAPTFTTRLPQPVVRGKITDGPHAGARAMAFRWASGFRYTLEGVRRSYPNGIELSIATWIWRRILEILDFLHRSQIVHGAVQPAHVLVQEGDHGARLVGFGHASDALAPASDLQQSARCIAYALGGDVQTAAVPATVPSAFATLIRDVASADDRVDAWTLRERVGEVGRTLFGPPRFCPLTMPKEP